MRTIPISALVLVMLGCSAEDPGSIDVDLDRAPRREGDRPSAPAETQLPASPAETDAGAPSGAGSPPRDAGPPAPSCDTPGPTVYGFHDDTDAWTYSTSPELPAGFTEVGAVFRLAPPLTPAIHASLFLLTNPANGDYLVSKVSSEGATIGYAVSETLGAVFLEQVRGAVPLVRYYREEPALRHRVGLDATAPDGWIPEPPRGWVCPL